MTSMRPVPGMYPVSQTFAGSFSTRFSGGASHGAIDIATPVGTPVVAPDDGVIVHASWAWDLPGGPNDWAARWFQLKPAVGNTKGGGGIMTVLRNDVGSVWIFAHLSSNDEAPKGKRVRRGDIIGKTGNTGTSTGPHLHLALIPPNPNWSNGTYGSTDPLPWLTIAFKPNTHTSWTGGSTGGTGSSGGKTPTARDLWIPGAERRPQSGGVKLDTSLPPRITWHITSDVDPGKQQPTIDAVASYLERVRYYPHVIWDPFTGRIIQWLPANVGGRALSAWNQDGSTHLQVEILFSQGAIRNGKRYNQLSETPLKGFDTILRWADGWGIPRTWPMGPTPKLHTSGRRDVNVWNTKAGHYGHSQVPGNNHTDPGIFPDINSRPRATATQAKDWFDMATKKDLEEVVDARVKTTINHMFNRSTEDGVKIMDRIAAENRGSIKHMIPEVVKAVFAALLPGRGSAKGTMAAGESLAWDRHARAHTESQLEGLRKDLDLVLVTLAAQTTKTTEKEASNGDH